MPLGSVLLPCRNREAAGAGSLSEWLRRVGDAAMSSKCCGSHENCAGAAEWAGQAYRGVDPAVVEEAVVQAVLNEV